MKKNIYFRKSFALAICISAFCVTTTNIMASASVNPPGLGLNFWGGWGVASNQSIATVSGATTGGVSAGLEGWFAFGQVQLGLQAAYLPIWRYDQSAIGIAYSGSAAYIPATAVARYFIFKGVYAGAGAGLAIGLARGATTAGTPFVVSLEVGLRHNLGAAAAIQVFVRNYFFATTAYVNDFVPGVAFSWKF